MNYNAIQFSEGKLHAYDPITGSKKEFKEQVFVTNKLREAFHAAIPSSYSVAGIWRPKEGEVYPLPAGYRIYIHRHSQNVPCCDEETEECNGTCNPYALLLPIREENSAHGYTEGSDVPFEQLTLYTDKTPTVATDSTVEPLPVELSPSLQALTERMENEKQEIFNKIGYGEPSESRKLAMKELIEYIDLLKQCAGVDRINLDNVRAKAQSLIPKEEENIKEAYWKGNEEVEKIKNEPFGGGAADRFFTQTYSKP
jgi:hypothetical protein